MSAHVDGVLMCIPLDFTLANIFIGFHEKFLFGRRGKPHVYLPYIHESFPISDSIKDAEVFHVQLISLYSSLQLTMVLENVCALPFLDVFLERKEG